MESNGIDAKVRTPVKEQQGPRSKNQEITSKVSENSNPNVGSPGPRSSRSPAIKSAKTQKSASEIANRVVSPRNKIRQRKFIVAKKNPKKDRALGAPAVVCKCKERNGGNAHKCLCVAYENLRASQEDFFKNRGSLDDQCDLDQLVHFERAALQVGEGDRNGNLAQTLKFGALNEGKGDERKTNEKIKDDSGVVEVGIGMGNSTIKRAREKLLEEALDSVPEPGSGRVMHLVKAFERILSIPKNSDEKEGEDIRKGLKWDLPGFRPKVPETDGSLSSLCPSELLLTSENLGLESQVSSSWDSTLGSFSISSRTSCGGRRSGRNSSDSSGTTGVRNWRRKRQPRATSQKPFKLRTEQRGRHKEEEFIKKVKDMIVEEEKRRIPIAQGLPWTTDEPECLVKPPIKDITRPVDLKLHSDVRAVERAEFDHQVAEKLSLIEQYRMERARQQKLEEEEEVRRLRKELVPKAQPMPYFDRPFVPRRSMKDLTVPKEPKFNMPHQKKTKCCLSWDDINIYNHHM